VSASCPSKSVLDQLADWARWESELNPDPAGAESVLVARLSQVPDLRRRKGLRHRLVLILVLSACATLVTGSDSMAAIWQWAARAPQDKLARLGARWNPFTRRFIVPSERTFRRVLARVDARTRRRVEDTDPGLDDDLAAWADPACTRPRLTLLGPVQVTATGALPETRPRRAWNTEVVAYLACHPKGVTAEQLGTALWPDDPDIAAKSKLRQAVHIVRRWLGVDPRTGREHVPPALNATGGPALYRVEGLLVDAELFRRLRLRGVARGEEGLGDLEAALALVTGIPFDQRRPGGYAWLVETPLDLECTAMIVDVAHLVATRHLTAERPGLAVVAAEVSLLAGGSDDIALLDLIAAHDALGNRAEADRLVHQIMATHGAEVEEDLPPRTAEVLYRRGRLGRTG